MLKRTIMTLVLVTMAAFTIMPSETRADPVNDKINARCLADWPGDFRMQKACRTMQVDGANDVRAWMSRHDITNGQEQTPWGQMFRKCSADWGNGGDADWRMFSACLKVQEGAYGSL